MPSIFTQIVNGEIPCYKIAEDDRFLAFLDVFPTAKGHTICIPKKETDKLFDLDQKTYLDLMAFSQKVAKAVEKAVPCKRVGMAVIGLEVPHVHVHLIPLNSIADMDFTHKKSFAKEVYESVAEAIKMKLSEN